MLLQQVLELKLQLALCNPHQSAEVLIEIDRLQKDIQLITKLPMRKVIDVCNARYPQFVADQVKSGKIKQVTIS
jgi:hypothetical protein